MKNQMTISELKQYIISEAKKLYKIEILKEERERIEKELSILSEKKYSDKASKVIGKEISHLQKDKGYPHDRAVAAAINVAKEKGFKIPAPKNENTPDPQMPPMVGNKKKNLNESVLLTLGGIALGASVINAAYALYKKLTADYKPNGETKVINAGEKGDIELTGYTHKSTGEKLWALPYIISTGGDPGFNPVVTALYDNDQVEKIKDYIIKSPEKYGLAGSSSVALANSDEIPEKFKPRAGWRTGSW